METYNEQRAQGVLRVIQYSLDVRAKLSTSARTSADSAVFFTSDHGLQARELIRVYAEYDLKDLRKVAGVGPKTACAILAAREAVTAERNKTK